MLHIHLDAIRRTHIYAWGNLVSSRRGLCNNIWATLPAQMRKRPDILYFDRLCHNQLLSSYIFGRRSSDTITILLEDSSLLGTNIWKYTCITRACYELCFCSTILSFFFEHMYNNFCCNLNFWLAMYMYHIKLHAHYIECTENKKMVMTHLCYIGNWFSLLNVHTQFIVINM